MSKKTSKDDNDSAPDVEDDGDDVTEIIPAEPPEAKPAPDDGDVTKIVFSRDKPADAAKTSLKDLPGAVIGVAGARAAAEPPSTPSTSQSQSAPATGDDETDEHATTKILFDAVAPSAATAPDSAEAAPPVEDESSETPSKDAQREPTVSDEVGPPETENEPAAPSEPDKSAEEKTVFLPPVSASKKQDDFNPPVGWLVIIDGPGRGAALTVHYGQNTIGRGDDQQIQLNFGDTRIARDTHAYLIYDEIERTFYLRDAGQKNLVRVNQKPVLAPVALSSHDTIQIGATTCLFVALCTSSFDWLGGEDDPATGPGNTEGTS